MLRQVLERTHTDAYLTVLALDSGGGISSGTPKDVFPFELELEGRFGYEKAAQVGEMYL